MTSLNEAERRKIFEKVVATTSAKFADPSMNGVDWVRVAKEAEGSIVLSADLEEFERRVN